MTDIKSFKIPYALDENNSLVVPTQALKGRQYSCPGCNQSLILRQGKVVRAHFSHPASTHCSVETALHKAAKLAIKKVVETWIITGENRPVIQNRCFSCSSAKGQLLPATVRSVQLETRLASDHIADVVLTDGEKIVLAVEIVVSHEVSEEKGLAMPVYWIELAANDILSDPIHWNPKQFSLKKFGCKRCHSSFLRFKAECESLAKLSDVKIPETGFLYGPAQCEKCDRWCLVFFWNKNEFQSKNAPRTVMFLRTNEYVGWSNTCAWCSNAIPLYYLRQRHCPFWFMEPDEALDKNRAKGLVTVALHYFSEVRPLVNEKVAPPRKL